MTANTLTPNEAATRLGVARSSVMRAIKSGKLQAFRDNHGHWRVLIDDLERVTADRVDTQPVSDRPPDLDTQAVTLVTPAVTPMDTPETLARLAAAEAERDQLRERLDELRGDRDEWRRMAEKLADQAAHKAAPRRWWPWK